MEVAAARVGGDELLVVLEKESVGVELERELLRGVERRHGAALGFQNDMADAVIDRPPLRHLDPRHPHTSRAFPLPSTHSP